MLQEMQDFEILKSNIDSKLKLQEIGSWTKNGIWSHETQSTKTPAKKLKSTKTVLRQLGIAMEIRKKVILAISIALMGIWSLRKS